MKKLTIPCIFGDERVPFPLYIGEPAPDCHPLRYQAAWVAGERGGAVPPEVMDSFEKLHTIAKEQRVSFEELCVYALSQQKGAPAS